MLIELGLAHIESEVTSVNSLQVKQKLCPVLVVARIRLTEICKERSKCMCVVGDIGGTTYQNESSNQTRSDI